MSAKINTNTRVLIGVVAAITGGTLGLVLGWRLLPIGGDDALPRALRDGLCFGISSTVAFSLAHLTMRSLFNGPFCQACGRRVPYSDSLRDVIKNSLYLETKVKCYCEKCRGKPRKTESPRFCFLCGMVRSKFERKRALDICIECQQATKEE